MGNSTKQKLLNKLKLYDKLEKISIILLIVLLVMLAITPFIIAYYNKQSTGNNNKQTLNTVATTEIPTLQQQVPTVTNVNTEQQSSNLLSDLFKSVENSNLFTKI